MMPRILLWLLAAILSIAFTALAFLPATWMAAIIENQSAGRLMLGDAQGTLWNGSAFVGGSAGPSDPVTPLLPGRFTWQLSPLVLLGNVDVSVQNTEALSQPLTVTGSWNHWLVSPASISLPAERLATLGAPLNTVQPAGLMQLSWSPLQLALHQGQVEMTGSMNLRMRDISSRMSPIKPLGDYNLAMDWQETKAVVTLSTLKGPMLLNGAGAIINGRLQFSGSARAEDGHEERLGNFLNLLGQHRIENGRDVIALEFK